MAKRAHILILIGGHLATAPRPQKEAAAARAAGFRVTIRGNWWSERLAIEDLELSRAIDADFAPMVDLRPGSHGRLVARLRQRIAGEGFRRFGILSPRVYGLGAPELFREAQKQHADLTMVHSEAGLWIGRRLLNLGFRVGVDFEDWFSEDLREEDRKTRPVVALKALEREMLNRAQMCLAPTRVMAEALAEDSGGSLPLVIPNCFPWHGAPKNGQAPMDNRSPEAVSFYWFSQTIGPGRGLEILAQALVGLLGNWELHVRGELREHQGWFELAFPSSIRSRVIVEPTVSNADLSARSASHDIGLALELPDCRSRDLTATNKIFEYLRCGLAVVATATRGQQEIMKVSPEVGWLVPSGEVDPLRRTLQRCIDNPSLVAAARKAARRAAEVDWAWESHAGSLQERFLRLLA